ncbi:MAG: hypothetical protein O3A81_02130, partial [bacterium]|nr:hypothetical protein [bacterium]
MENRLIYFTKRNTPRGSAAEQPPPNAEYINRLQEVKDALGNNSDAANEIGKQIEAATKGAGELEDKSIAAIESAGNMAFKMDFDAQIGSDAQLDPLNAQFS